MPLLNLILSNGYCPTRRRIFLVYLRIVIAAALILVSNQAGAACVWKVTRGTNVLYLGGSIHALKSSDYPLPAAYNLACDASDRLVFEVDPKARLESSKSFAKRFFKSNNIPTAEFIECATPAEAYRVIENSKWPAVIALKPCATTSIAWPTST